MNRRRLLLSIVVLALAFSAFASTAVRAQQKDIKVGVILPLTGLAAAVGPEIQMGVKFAFQEVDNKIEGRNVVVKFEDETDDPANSVARAKKLVEEDGVDVILGPQLAHTAAAVSAYMEQAGVPHIVLGASDTPTSKFTFYPGSGRGDAYVTGEFAYNELKARTAAVIFQDYLFGQQSRDGFTNAFTKLGGKVESSQAVPFGTADMAPFLEKIGKADVVAVLLINPSDFAFVRQYRQAGLKQPVIFISNAPQEAPLLTEMGDAVIGMYGASWYSPLIDTPTNGKFVEAFIKANNRPPGMAVHIAYSAAAMFIEAVKATKGDTSPKAINDALVGLKKITNPAGTITVGEARVATHDHYIFQVDKQDKFYVWKVVKKYENVEPR
jgi:branched-chain amino acid transport system substrate-binding protein